MIRRLLFWLATIGLFIGMGGAAMADESELVIKNESLKVSYDSLRGVFTLTDLKNGVVFASDVVVCATSGPAKISTDHHRVFGKGNVIEAPGTDGGRVCASLYKGLPFVLFSATISNSLKEPVARNRVEFASIRLDLGKPTEHLKAFGTGGLKSPAENPGSYVWQAVVDPDTRSGVVAGWLTQDRASGVLFTDTADHHLTLRARSDYGRLLLEANGRTVSETLAVGYFEDAGIGLETWADAVAKVYDIHLPVQPTGYCTWYAENHGGASDEKALEQLAVFAAKNLKPYGFNFVQIDDGWQLGASQGNGPNKNFTANNPKGPYPSGMKAIADRLRNLGLTAGIWCMPFAGTYNDPWFKDHQDWFVKRTDGKPYDTSWGGTSIDMTNPSARKYMEEWVHRITHDWGFGYIKIDGLYTGTGTQQVYVNDGYRDDGMGDAVFSDPRKTNVEAFRDGMKLVRKAAGNDTFILGCCAPQNMRSYGGAMGLVDAMRIGPDNSGSWGGWLSTSPVYGTRNWFLNGRVWYNDPDPGYGRASIPLEQTRLIFSWMAVAGQLNTSSDWMPALTPDRMDVLKRTMPAHGLHSHPVDVFDVEPARIWILTDGRKQPSRNIVALFNYDNKQNEMSCTFKRLGLRENEEYSVFDFWQNMLLPNAKTAISMNVPSQDCCILSLMPVSDRPVLISTSRHVTQGMIDVDEERWDASSSTLSGTSRVVAGDPYELRIVVEGKGKRWSVTSAHTDVAEAAFTQEDRLARITIKPTETGIIHWSIRFKPTG